MEGETEARSVTATIWVNNCQEDDSDSADTETPCETGDTKLADDGCNQCVCSEGEWFCTEMDCNPDDNTTKAEDDSNISVPSVSLVSSIAAIGIIALRRRY
jgi:hypothetical protein